MIYALSMFSRAVYRDDEPRCAYAASADFIVIARASR